jgi:riboflavin synthase
MFTGIVEHRGSVVSTKKTAGGREAVIDVGPLTGIEVGDSLNVNGVCLTAVEIEGSRVKVEMVEETLDRSNLGLLDEQSPVNLERAMPAAGRFDGHVVQGHVDGVGTLRSVTPEGDGSRLTIEIPPGLMRYVVEKGSITVDGISLTVAAVTDDSIDIAVIPHTLSVTTLGLRNMGDQVNLEVDVIAKYVEKLLKADE